MSRHPLRRALCGRPWLGLAVALCGLPLALAVVTAPLEAHQQIWLALGGLLAYLAIDRLRGHGATLALMLLSVLVSLRYLLWRVTETTGFEGGLQTFLGTGLLLAEIYAITTLLLSYFQTAWPLERRPVPLPDDPALWPTVDVLIPTYNEPLSVVKPTVFGALALDWPREKLRVLLLDDGDRPEFRAFAQAAGAEYVARAGNAGAKAGNINHALATTGGEYVVVFDCDHVPTRAFLQLTLGWMLRDRRIGMVQTPHHFHTRDPFQRNLASGERVPNEGLLFYGLVQPGNDFWDAAFFCGSCAVMRREAVEQVGGVPTETVTEDCHLSLRLQRRGWRSAYLRVPLAAGLATDRLRAHIGQRMRWARGMIQILRTENPLLVSGLRLPQRLCYFMAMVHFCFPLPRFVFLTAPLAFLLLDQNVIAASPLAIVAYAGPHVLHSVATGSRVQGRVRHSFWSEVYETVLAVHLLPVVLMTLLDPKKGKFNVTDKGGSLEEGYYDFRAVGWNLGLAVLLLAGLFAGARGLLAHPPESAEFQAFALNLLWAVLCLLTVLAGLAVGRERRQVAGRSQVAARLPVTLHHPGGRDVAADSLDLSAAGATLLAPQAEALADATALTATFGCDPEPVTLPVEVLRWRDGRLVLRFAPAGLEDEAAVARLVFGRADAWLDWDAVVPDRPLRSLGEIARSIGGLFSGDSQLTRGRARRRAALPVAPPTAARRTVALLPALLLPGLALAQPLDPGVPAPNPSPLSAAQPAPVLAGPALDPDPEPGPGARRVVRTLRQLGLRAPMQLRGTSDLQGVQFGVRGDEVVTAARLTLAGATSPALIPELSQVAVTLNDQFVAALQPDRARPAFGPVSHPIDPAFFADANRLNFRFSGRYAVECNDPLSGLLWTTISDTSTVELTLERLPLAPDLARLPEPFFDPRLLRDPLVLPVVLPDLARAQGAADGTLRAAAIASSWFAVQADHRGASFPVQAALPAQGHAVVVAVGQDAVPGLAMPRLEGPTLAVLAHPSDPRAHLLLVGGRTPAEAAEAALALAAAEPALAGEVARVRAPAAVARRPYDAPRWVRTDRPVRLGELVDAAELQSYGYAPGPVTVPFRTAPDLYTWRGRPMPTELRFRGPPAPVADLAVSRLDATLNGVFLRGLPLREAGAGGGFSWSSLWPLSWPGRALAATDAAEGRVGVPPWLVAGQNELGFRFDLRPLNRGDCVAVPGDLRAAVDPDSTIDLSGAHRFATLPDLAAFAGAGFPFTVLADLSGTAAILPERPTAVEAGAFLDLVGRMAAHVGHAATGLRVVRPGGLDEVSGLDLLVFGALDRQPALAALLREGPLTLEAGRLQVALPGPLAGFRSLFPEALWPGAGREAARDRAQAVLSAPGEGTGALIGFESPLAAGRSVVALTGTTPQGMEAMLAALRDAENLPRVRGDVALVSGGRVSGYALGATYDHGRLPAWLWPQRWLAGRPDRLLLAMLAAVGLVALPTYWALRRRAAVRLRERS